MTALIVAGGLTVSSLSVFGAGALAQSAGASTAPRSLATIQAALNKLAQPKVAQPMPTKPVKVGKHSVAVISVGQATSGAKDTATFLQQAIKVAGWTAPPTYDGQFSPTVWSTDIETAVNNGAQAIFLIAINPLAVSSALQQAATKNVKVICVLCGPPSAYAAFPKIVGVEPSPGNIGVAQADWVIVDTKGKGKIWVYQDNEFAETVAQTGAALHQLAVACPGCKVHTAQTQAGDELVPGIPVLTSVLSANPKGSINDIIAPYDGAAAAFSTLANSDGRSEIHFVGYAGLPVFFNQVRAGSPPGSKADISIPLPFMAWSAVDEAARMLNHLPTWNANNLNVAVIDKADVAKFNASLPYVAPTVAYQTIYKHLWGR